MKEGNVIREKSFAFAIRIVRAYQYLVKEKKEYVLSKQLLRSGTSIGANIEESVGGLSKKDFIYKISLSYREARETIFWIKLITATGYFSGNLSTSLLNDAEEICKILGKIQISFKRNQELIKAATIIKVLLIAIAIEFYLFRT